MSAAIDLITAACELVEHCERTGLDAAETRAAAALHDELMWLAADPAADAADDAMDQAVTVAALLDACVDVELRAA